MTRKDAKLAEREKLPIFFNGNPRRKGVIVRPFANLPMSIRVTIGKPTENDRFLSALAEVLSNDRPLVARYEGELFFPVLRNHSEVRFGGEPRANFCRQFGHRLERVGQPEVEVIPQPRHVHRRKPPARKPHAQLLAGEIVEAVANRAQKNV